MILKETCAILMLCTIFSYLQEIHKMSTKVKMETVCMCVHVHACVIVLFAHMHACVCV